jgi:hypothetical protein
MYGRRLQILLDEARYRRVAARARDRKTSVAAIIREAIDVALPDDPDRKRAAGRAILAAPPISVPETLEELKAEIDAAHARGV